MAGFTSAFVARSAPFSICATCAIVRVTSASRTVTFALSSTASTRSKRFCAVLIRAALFTHARADDSSFARACCRARDMHDSNSHWHRATSIRTRVRSRRMFRRAARVASTACGRLENRPLTKSIFCVGARYSNSRLLSFAPVPPCEKAGKRLAGSHGGRPRSVQARVSPWVSARVPRRRGLGHGLAYFRMP